MKIIIAGAGEVGSHLAKMLSREGSDITIIDAQPERLAKLSATADVATVLGMPSSIKVLKSAGAANADLFISVYPHSPQEINLMSALLAKNLGARKVVARISDEEFLSSDNRLMFKEMGIELMFCPEKIAADEIIESLKHTSATDTMDFANGKLQIAVFKLEEDSPAMEMKIHEISSSIEDKELQFRVIAISREDKTIIPKFDTTLQYHDLVFTIAKREGIPALLSIFGENNIEVSRVMIFGGGIISEMVAASLHKQVETVKIIESSRQRCLELSEKLPDDILIANGDGRNSDFLLEESIKDFDAFIALTDSDETNILACAIAKRFGVCRTIAEVENLEYFRLAEDLRVDTVINKKLITAGRIFKFTLSGKARFVKYMSGTDAEILEYTVAPGSLITKAPLKNLGFPHDAIVGGVIRGTDSFIAVGDTVIEAYDRVSVFAMPDSVKAVDGFFK